MKQRATFVRVVATVLLSGVAAALAPVVGARSESATVDPFRHLSSEEIKVRFLRKVLTDDTHWRETYLPGGKLVAEQMGDSPVTGTWRVDHGQLCTMLPSVRDACYSVWASGERIELRHPDYPTVEAFLRPSRQPFAH